MTTPGSMDARRRDRWIAKLIARQHDCPATCESLPHYVWKITHDILTYLTDECATPPFKANPQWYQMLLSIEGFGKGILDGSIPLPAAAIYARTKGYPVLCAAVYRHLIMMIEEQVIRREFLNDEVKLVLNMLEGLADEIHVALARADAGAEKGSSDVLATQTRRPALSIIQSDGGRVPSQQARGVDCEHTNQLTIGSGIVHITYLRTDIPKARGIDLVKIMYPLHAEDVSERQTSLLHRLRHATQREMAQYYPGDIRHQTMKSSVQVIGHELQERGNEVPGLISGVNASFGRGITGQCCTTARHAASMIGARADRMSSQIIPATTGSARVPSTYGSMRRPPTSFSPQPRPRGHQLSFAGPVPTFTCGANPGSFYRRGSSGMASSVPMIPGHMYNGSGGRHDGLANIQTIGSGKVFAEYFYRVGPLLEVRLKHPVELKDLSDDMAEAVARNLLARLVSVNDCQDNENLEDPVEAAKYLARKQTLEALGAWLENAVQRRDEIAATAIATQPKGYEGKGKKPANEGVAVPTAEPLVPRAEDLACTEIDREMVRNLRAAASDFPNEDTLFWDSGLPVGATQLDDGSVRFPTPRPGTFEEQERELGSDHVA